MPNIFVLCHWNYRAIVI